MLLIFWQMMIWLKFTAIESKKLLNDTKQKEAERQVSDKAENEATAAVPTA